MIKKLNQFALLSTQGYPIHCVIISQTKYSEPLNLVVYHLSVATKMPRCMVIVIISTLSIRMINNLLVFICFLRILFVTLSHVYNLLRGTKYLVRLNLRKCRNMVNLVWFFDNAGLWREVVVSL